MNLCCIYVLMMLLFSVFFVGISNDMCVKWNHGRCVFLPRWGETETMATLAVSLSARERASCEKGFVQTGGLFGSRRLSM